MTWPVTVFCTNCGFVAKRFNLLQQMWFETEVKLYPSGLGEVREPAIPPKTGEAKAELRESVCDNCGRRLFGRTLTETLGAGAEGQEREWKT